MTKFTTLFSSSSGNSYLLESDDTKILIDAGKSGLKITNELKKLNININEIDCILLTHEHNDHLQSIFTLSRKYKIPIFISSELRNILDIKTEDKYINTFNRNEDFSIKDIQIKSFDVSHDAVSPVGFSFYNKDKKISIATDMGIFTDETILNIENSDLALIESNYEDSIIEVSKYPYFLKKRIKSSKGHLSNFQMQKLLKTLAKKDVKKFILGHLSKENNHPDIVLQTAHNALNDINLLNKPEIYIAPKEEKGITLFL